MARLRFKIELNPGGEGVRLDKLARLSGEVEKFLRHLATDIGVDAKVGEWVARDFYDSSFGASVEYIGHVEPSAVKKFNSGLRFFSRFQSTEAKGIGRYSQETLKQFVEIGEALDTDERFKIGVLDEDTNDIDIVWEHVSKQTTLLLDDAIRDEVEWFGSIQGALGTWYKMSNYFNLKDVATGATIKCIYPSSRYDEIYSLFRNKDAVVIATGRIRSDRFSGRAKEIRAEDFAEYASLSDDEFERLLRGREGADRSVDSTVNTIDRARGNGES